MDTVLILKILLVIYSSFDFLYRIARYKEINTGYLILVILIATQNFF